jgi:hypothetical protein
MLDSDTQDDDGGQEGDGDTWVAERVILLALLRDDHDERWTLAELRREVAPLPPQHARAGLTRLEQEGLAVRLDGHVLASRCALHLDSLGMVCI